jgi:hypothetical protein
MPMIGANPITEDFAFCFEIMRNKSMSGAEMYDMAIILIRIAKVMLL